MRNLLFVFVVGLLCVVRAQADEALLGAADFVPTPARPVGWRGDWTGRFPGADPVTAWNETTGSNVLWRVRLPFFSTSSPIMVGDRVFCMSEPDLLNCLDAKTGKVLWQRHSNLKTQAMSDAERDDVYNRYAQLLAVLEKWIDQSDFKHPGNRGASVAYYLNDKLPGDWKTVDPDRDLFVQAFAERNGIDLLALRTAYSNLCGKAGAEKYGLPHWKEYYPMVGNAMPTPTSDGQYVYVAFGNSAPAVAACYDLEGNRQWIVPLTRNWFSSPVLTRDALIVHHKPSLVALDKRTGKTLWSTEARQGSWAGTPVPMRINGVDFVVTAGSTVVRVSDGKAMPYTKDWRGDPMNHTGDAPVAIGDTVYCQIWRGGVAALKFELTSPDVLSARKLWQAESAVDGAIAHWGRASILYHDGILYFTGRDMAQGACDAVTGAVVPANNTRAFTTREWLMREWDIPNPQDASKRTRKRRFFGENYPSPTLGGRYVFHSFTDNTSPWLVTEAGRERKLVCGSNTTDMIVASPFFQGSRMYVRSYKYLYCIGGE